MFASILKEYKKLCPNKEEIEFLFELSKITKIDVAEYLINNVNIVTPTSLNRIGYKNLKKLITISNTNEKLKERVLFVFNELTDAKKTRIITNLSWYKQEFRTFFNLEDSNYIYSFSNLFEHDNTTFNLVMNKFPFMINYLSLNHRGGSEYVILLRCQDIMPLISTKKRYTNVRIFINQNFSKCIVDAISKWCLNESTDKIKEYEKYFLMTNSL